MIFNNFKEGLLNRLLQPLPGWEAQKEMASHRRLEWMNSSIGIRDYKRSAVMLLFFEKDGLIQTLLIQRPVYDGVHSNQMAFPGGKAELFDSDLIATAIRECREEISVCVHATQILGTLSEIIIPPSQYIVLPVLAWIESQPKVIPNPREVQNIFIFPLREIFKESNQKNVRIPGVTALDAVPAMVVHDNIIWGATAMILQELKQICLEIPF